MKILIVDDNIDFSSTLTDIIQGFGYECVAINAPLEAIDFMEKNHSEINLVLLDIEFGFGSKLNGLDLLNKFRKNYIHLPVVMISGKGTIETAVKATKLGAVNFIEKNIITKEKIRGVIESTFSNIEKRGEVKEIQKFLSDNGIIGSSQAILEVGDNIIRYGRTDLNVLITGETGTGKKLVAKAIHSISRRMRSEFITVDIPNIPKELFQSELFGHIKGSFSGATETKKGLFHEADKGTLFLDEIGDLSPDLQSNLLLPIEERYIRRVGATHSEAVDVRFISATDRDLFSMMKEGRFREQLYHRLRECEIFIPPLSSRKEDIPHIIDHYLASHNKEFYETKFFSPAAIAFLAEQKWPGNVRQLSSVIKVMLQTSLTEQIELSDVTKAMANRQFMYNNTNEKKFTNMQGNSLNRTLKEDLAEVDKIKIEQTLGQLHGNVSKSAAALGVSRETLHNKIRKYSINTQEFRNKSRT